MPPKKKATKVTKAASGKKNSLRAATLLDFSKMTHSKLDHFLTIIGESFREKAIEESGKRGFKKISLKNANAKVVRLMTKAEIIYDNKKFGEQFRNVEKGRDEAVSTSAHRAIFKGFHSAKFKTPLTEKSPEFPHLYNEIEKMALSRFNTEDIGVAFKNRRWQHPSNNFAVHADPKSREAAKGHSAFDLKRKQKVTSKGYQFALNRKASLREKINALRRASLAVTLNEGYAPPTARNVNPYLRLKLSKKQLREKNKIREGFKNLFVDLGGDRTLQPGKKIDDNWDDDSSSTVSDVREEKAIKNKVSRAGRKKISKRRK